MAAPLTSTVGASNVTQTTATIVGSVNTFGLTGTCWFEYGPTPALGSVSVTQTLPAAGWPQTFTAQLSGLTASLYYFAAVGSTSGGTVVAGALSFVPTPPAPPPPLTLISDVVVPHAVFPLRIVGSEVQVAEQDSIADVLSCVQMVLACPIGTCPELPTFGRPDLVFQSAPPNTADLVAAIQQWEPRATAEAITQALDATQANWAVIVDATTTASGS